MAKFETSAPAAPAAKATTPSYTELTTESYALFVDAFATANRRGLDYFKSLYEIASRPYASSAIEQTVRENFDRLNQVISVTIAELQNNGQKAAEFNEKLAKHNVKVSETTLEALRGLTKTGLSNLEYAKDTAGVQLESFAKGVADVQERVVSSVSPK
jgi:Cdc6-like AAA superfamily ATPase